MTGGAVFAYVGGFAMPDGPEGFGLHAFRVDTGTGALEAVGSVAPRLNVGAMIVDERRSILYCTDEVASTDEFRRERGAAGGGGGRIRAFSIDPDSGALDELVGSPSFGTLPAGIAEDPAGRYLVVSHFTQRAPVTVVTGDRATGFGIDVRYDDATTVLFPLADDGSIGPPADVHRHPSTGADEPSCLHSVQVSPDGSFFVVCDMARDLVLTFAIDGEACTLREVASHAAPEGSGPRYSVFHPSRPVFYANHELSPIVEAFAYEAGGAFSSVCRADVVPADWESRPGALQSGLAIHPTGRFLYTLIRGHDAVVAFAIDDSGRELRRIQAVAVGGAGPKGCVVSDDGRFLFVAASRSDAVLVWSIGDDGLLQSTGRSVSVERPGSIVLHEPSQL